jgi:hypothetical protein
MWVLYDTGVNSDHSLNSVNQLIFVMVKFGVFFEVRPAFLKYYLDELRLQRASFYQLHLKM